MHDREKNSPGKREKRKVLCRYQYDILYVRNNERER